MKTDSMQTRMKMDRKRKRAAGTVIKNVKWSSVFWGERERDTQRDNEFGRVKQKHTDLEYYPCLHFSHDSHKHIYSVGVVDF